MAISSFFCESFRNNFSIELQAFIHLRKKVFQLLNHSGRNLCSVEFSTLAINQPTVPSIGKLYTYFLYPEASVVAFQAPQFTCASVLLLWLSIEDMQPNQKSSHPGKEKMLPKAPQRLGLDSVFYQQDSLLAHGVSGL